MHLSVGGKLWLAFFCTLTLAVLTLYLLLQGSLKRGFLDYTSQQAVQRLEILQNALLSTHKDDGSFAQLVKDPQRWMTLKSIIFSESIGTESGSKGKGLERSLNQYHYREFVSSISLFDSDKNLLLGVIKPDKALTWAPIAQDEAVLGYVGFVKPNVVVREADRRFMAHQLRFFALTSLVILVISVAIAALLSRRLTRPIKALSQHTKALASGEFRQRINVQSRDEIGQLCENFNTLAQALEANEQSRANWIADISHEMRTPVAVLKAQIEAMQDGIRPLDRQSLALLQQKVDSLNRLVDDLFELTLSDIGSLNYKKETLSLDRLAASCVEQFQSRAAEAGLTLNAGFSSGSILLLHGDAKRLEQLFVNLLENAVRYTDAGGKIEVELLEEAERIIFLVRDSAPTVAPDQRKKIFERLHRLESSRSRSTGGAGLGLAICASIVAAHQGSIMAEDSPLGGLTIRVELPQHHSKVPL